MAALRLFTFAALLGMITACSLTNRTPIIVEETTPESRPIVYYYFASGDDFPAGSVVILADSLVLSPTAIPGSADVAANIQAALQAAIADPRNAWTSNDLTLTSVTFDNGHAEVVLSGEISGAGDIVRIAARMQFLLTVFAEPAVQTATITLNGESIGNLGISHSSEAKPADYAYTRAEIEQFIAENALS
ncbi:MAG TPA: hypothetical protein VK003_06625 [Oceanobacillus sp.]|nr:hypothetical protein [Oceanobacillus sp.]